MTSALAEKSCFTPFKANCQLVPNFTWLTRNVSVSGYDNILDAFSLIQY